MAKQLKVKSDNFSAIEHWFSGKALAAIRDFVIPTLRQALADKRWPKGASRKVHAALNKLSGETKKIARQARAQYKALDYNSKPAKQAWFAVDMAMNYGGAEAGPRLGEALKVLAAQVLSGDQGMIVMQAAQFHRDFAPVLAAVDYLDSLRPMPVFVMGGTLSATVTKTITEAGLDSRTVRLPEMRSVEIERVDPKTGKVYRVMMIEILWPKNTVHGGVRFGGRSPAGNNQCEACGHAIKNRLNWVPLLLDDADKVPHSMWVGRDCASNLFDCDMSGEAEYVSREVRP